jgi:glutamine amidotransferase-like uncharacterized protein
MEMILLDKYKIILLVVFFSLGTILLMNSNTANHSLNASNNKSGSTTLTKVLIYYGDGVMENSVLGIEDSLNDSKNLNIPSHNKFEYSTTSEINSDSLYGYDVLIMPGGDASKYVEDNDINSESIKKFVKEGNGYIGICAGAYAASNSVDGYYSGWGIAPDVNTKNVKYEGLLPLTITSFGNTLINGTLINLRLENGPALYSNNSNIVMASYADNKTGYQNYAAIIGETYGSGRVLLSGPHPELNPQNSQLLAYMVLWASGKI